MEWNDVMNGKVLLRSVSGLLVMWGLWSVPATAEEVSQGEPPAIAVYRWGAANRNGGAKAVEKFGQWLGDPDVWAVDFEAKERWRNNIAGGNWQLPEWQKWKNKNPEKRRLILSVPLLPGDWNRSGSKSPDEPGPVSHQAGANGEYNKYFAELAQNLVNYGLGDSILRLGWEMNGGWYTWRCAKEYDAFKNYWKNIVETMRAVPGAEKLEFCWNPALSWQQFPADLCYPGDEYVDYIGLDVYDESWAKNSYPLTEDMTPEEIERRRDVAWNDWIYGGNFGIKWLIEFGKKHNKPICFPEWGISKRKDNHGGLDNPKFIERMHKIITDPANNVAWHGYFDVQAPDGSHQLSEGLNGNEKVFFPKSAETFKKLFGNTSDK